MMPVASEIQESIALIDWVRLVSRRYPELVWFFAVPNGAYRDKREAAKLKASGVRAGVSDYVLPAARGGYHGLFIELKRRRDFRVSVEQLNFIADMHVAGYRAVVCRGWDAARDEIESYLALPKTGNTLNPNEELSCSPG